MASPVVWDALFNRQGRCRPQGSLNGRSHTGYCRDLTDYLTMGVCLPPFGDRVHLLEFIAPQTRSTRGDFGTEVAVARLGSGSGGTVLHRTPEGLHLPLVFATLCP